MHVDNGRCIKPGQLHPCLGEAATVIRSLVPLWVCHEGMALDVVEGYGGWTWLSTC